MERAGLGGTSGSYVTMWQRVRAFFSTKGLDARTVQWIWAVNHEDVGTVRAEELLPRRRYVDWIGIDGYNWGSSQTWSIVAHAGRGVRSHARSAAPDQREAAGPHRDRVLDRRCRGGSTSPRSRCGSRELFNYATATATGARMIVWFNEDKETDWSVFGGTNGDETYRSGRTTYKAYRSYKAAVQGPGLLSPATGELRLITDLRFSGGW